MKNAASTTLTNANNGKWVATVNQAIDFCVQKVNENSEQLRRSLKGRNVDNRDVCSPIPQFVGQCIFAKQIADCPFKSNTSKKCTDLFSFYQRCTVPLLWQ